MTKQQTEQTEAEQLGEIRCLGDLALVIEFANRIEPEINRRVLALEASLLNDPIPGLRETLPSYRSLMVVFDPHTIRRSRLCEIIYDRMRDAAIPAPPGRQWLLPVAYGGADGMDLAELAAQHGLSTEQVINTHAEAEYRVYMIGFMPGYAYLGGLPEILWTSRRTTPRQVTPAGGVGIGGQQTSISSVLAPSGWNFIGRCPARLFDPDRAEPFLLQAGDIVRLQPIALDALDQLDRREAAGELCATLQGGAA